MAAAKWLAAASYHTARMARISSGVCGEKRNGCNQQAIGNRWRHVISVNQCGVA